MTISVDDIIRSVVEDFRKDCEKNKGRYQALMVAGGFDEAEEVSEAVKVDFLAFVADVRKSVTGSWGRG